MARKRDFKKAKNRLEALSVNIEQIEDRQAKHCIKEITDTFLFLLPKDA